MSTSTPSLRSRHQPQIPTPQTSHNARPETPPTTSKTSSPPTSHPAYPRITSLDILRILAGALLLSCTLSYLVTQESLLWGWRPAFTRPARIGAYLRGPLNLTPSQLRKYDGSDASLPILLALNSTIYDVSTSPHLYGPGGGYHFFAGRDATRAFVTGCFETDLTGDLRGVEEMFMPVAEDDDEMGDLGNKDRKIRRERELRAARKKVEEVVRGWRDVFEKGGKGYFTRGRLVGVSWEGEVRELCDKAKGLRPKRGGDGG